MVREAGKLKSSTAAAGPAVAANPVVGESPTSGSRPRKFVIVNRFNPWQKFSDFQLLKVSVNFWGMYRPKSDFSDAYKNRLQDIW